MTKKALLVGINRYAEAGSDLRGCVNDALLVRSFLVERYGFTGEGTRLLIDGAATGKGIREGLAWLTADARAGDTLVFHYSGHGSQVPDRHGDEGTDRLDEILCPHDMDWDDPLTDDELGRTFATLPPGALATVFLDCCHSGTGLRDASLPGDGTRHRYLAHPGFTSPLAFRRRRPHPALPACAVLLSGCRDDQTSADALIDGRYHGAFTFCLHEALRSAGWTLSFRELALRTREGLRARRFSQEPQLEGPEPLLDLPVPGIPPRKGGAGESFAA